VWRLASDRVLVRNVGSRGEHAITELQGDVLLAWVALDEPGTAAQVASRLGSRAVDELATALRSGVDAGVLRAVAHPGANVV